MRPDAPSLLIDIGNTSVKIQRATTQGFLDRVRRVPTVSLSGEDAARNVLGVEDFSRVVLCSVVPGAARWLEAAVPGGVPITTVGPHLRGLPVDLGKYPQKRSLGADRLANMAGAMTLYDQPTRPMIVVDFGTAATFNVLDGERRFLGGVIAPGLASMRDYLPSRGAQLPALGRLRVPASAVGKSTRAAMLSGIVIGYCGLVREILHSLQRQAPGSLVVATGGDARFAARLLGGEIHRVEPALTMHGLLAIAGLT